MTCGKLSAGESVVYSDTEDTDQQENGCIDSQPFKFEPEPDNDEPEQALGMSISNLTREAQPTSSASQSVLANELWFLTKTQHAVLDVWNANF